MYIIEIHFKTLCGFLHFAIPYELNVHIVGLSRNDRLQRPYIYRFRRGHRSACLKSSWQAARKTAHYEVFTDGHCTHPFAIHGDHKSTRTRQNASLGASQLEAERPRKNKLLKCTILKKHFNTLCGFLHFTRLATVRSPNSWMLILFAPYAMTACDDVIFCRFRRSFPDAFRAFAFSRLYELVGHRPACPKSIRQAARKTTNYASRCRRYFHERWITEQEHLTYTWSHCRFAD